jgi:hypothetical protein
MIHHLRAVVFWCGIGALSAAALPAGASDAQGKRSSPEVQWHSATDLPVGDYAPGNMVIVLGNQSGMHVTPPLVAKIGSGEERSEVMLRDGNHTGATSSFPTGEMAIEVVDSEGRRLWTDLLPVADGVGTVQLFALLTPAGVRVSMTRPDSDQGVGPSTSAGGGGPTMRGDRYPEGSAGSGPGGSPYSGARTGGGGLGGSPAGLLVALIVGLVVGFGLPPALRWFHRPRTRLLRIGTAGPDPVLPGAPPILGQKQVWVLPGADDVRQAFLELARELSDVVSWPMLEGR